MPLLFECPQCGDRRSMAQQSIGRRVRCPSCDSLIEVVLNDEREPVELDPKGTAPVTAELAEARHFKLRDPKGKWHPYSTNVIYLVVNTSRVDRVPTSYRELIAPRFRAQGPIAFSNPTVSGTAYTIVTSLVSVLGWDFVDAMLTNAWVTDSSDSMFKWVKDGETAAGFLFEASLRDYVASGAPLKPVMAEEGLITQSDGAGLIAGGPHPQNALAFLSYMASAEAHEIVRTRVGRRSARDDVAPAEGLLDLTGRKLIRADPLWAGRDRAKILARFDEAREKL